MEKKGIGMSRQEAGQLEWLEEDRPLGELRNYDNNPRTITKEAFKKLCDSIREDGYHGRILIDRNNKIIGGHQRKEAMLKVGYKKSDLVKVLVPCRDLTDDEFDRLNIRDNLPFGDFDFDILGNRFDAQKLIDWGMPEDWLNLDVTSVPTEEDDEEVMAAHDPICKLGDLWILGNHRLFCGDSTDPLAVERVLAGESPNLMVTDPPYGVSYDPSWREGQDLGVGKRSKGKVLNDDRIDWFDAYNLFTGNIVYVWHAANYTHLVAQSIINSGFDLVAQIIWAKQHFVLSRGDYHWQHEPCWYAVRKGNKHNWQGARDQSTLWEIKNNNSFGNSDKEETVGHGTQKPIEAMLRPILNNSGKGDGVYDPFLGSGTTLIACERADRRCFGIELSPNYCDAIIKRWEKATGQTAVLDNRI